MIIRHQCLKCGWETDADGFLLKCLHCGHKNMAIWDVSDDPIFENRLLPKGYIKHVDRV